MSQKDAIYLDVNAGAFAHPRVTDALVSLFQSQNFGANPSSVHTHGRKSKNIILAARDQIAQSLGTPSTSKTFTFTSSGTRANQLAIRSVFEPLFKAGKKAHWITTAVEHECNLSMVNWIQAKGGEVSLLPVDSNGAPIISALKNLIRTETALVSVIWVNNETGVITDVVALAKECAEWGIPLHLDGAQAWGKIEVNLDQLEKAGVTYAAFAPHKIGGLSGTGILWNKKGAPLKARRSGTENILGIFAAGVAASQINLQTNLLLADLRDRLQLLIQSRISGVLVNGGEASRIAGTLNLCFEGLEKDGAVTLLDMDGFCVSSGSACASGVVDPSHVLLALGRSPGLAAAGIRISIPDNTRWEDLERFVLSLEKVVNRLRNLETSAGTSAKTR